MLIREVYNRLREYSIRALNNSTVTIVYANQPDAPRPLKPFLTISINSMTKTGQDIRFEIDNVGIRKTLLTKSFIATFQSYADGLHEAEGVLEDIQNHLGTQIAQDVFQSEMSYTKTILGVSAIPTAISGINESRAILEIEFELVQEVADNVGLIEHIHITDLNDNSEIIINK